MSKYVYAKGLTSLKMDGVNTWRMLRLLERIVAAGACSARLQVLREARERRLLTIGRRQARPKEDEGAHLAARAHSADDELALRE